LLYSTPDTLWSVRVTNAATCSVGHALKLVISSHCLALAIPARTCYEQSAQVCITLVGWSVREEPPYFIKAQPPYVVCARGVSMATCKTCYWRACCTVMCFDTSSLSSSHSCHLWSVADGVSRTTCKACYATHLLYRYVFGIFSFCCKGTVYMHSCAAAVHTCMHAHTYIVCPSGAYCVCLH